MNNPDPDSPDESSKDAARVVIPDASATEIEHHVYASSFADPADVRAFRKWFTFYWAHGYTDQDATKLAFRKGDNGIGCFGDDCTGPDPFCALPPEDMEERWGSLDAAKHKPVEVSANNHAVICKIGDRMPHRPNIENGAGIDLNPPAVFALGLEPPIMIKAVWRWVA